LVIFYPEDMLPFLLILILLFFVCAFWSPYTALAEIYTYWPLKVGKQETCKQLVYSEDMCDMSSSWKVINEVYLQLMLDARGIASCSLTIGQTRLSLWDYLNILLQISTSPPPRPWPSASLAMPTCWASFLVRCRRWQASWAGRGRPVGPPGWSRLATARPPRPPPPPATGRPTSWAPYRFKTDQIKYLLFTSASVERSHKVLQDM
jgi:hypothetical protein